MSYGYSTDLRERVVSYIDGGHSKAEASRVFQVSRPALYDWLQLREQTGSLQMRRTGKKTPHKIGDQHLAECVANHPDAYLSELGETLQVSASGVWRALKRTGLSRKKNHALSGTKRSRAQPIS